MDSEQSHLPIDLQRALAYAFFVNQCPSLKNYVVSLGFHLGYRTHAELREFCQRIGGKRSAIESYTIDLALMAKDWQCPN